VLYADGLGVTQDDQEALRWYKLAAAQGMATAQYRLGNIYKRGDGVAIDSVRAHMWFDLSAAQGERFSVIERDSIAKRLTSQQMAEAQKLARECLARKYQDY
jgi:TPR repeat protein